MAEPLVIVILFDHAAITGGQAKVALDSAVGLKRAGHRPIVFAAAGPVSPDLTAAGIETICLEQSDLVGNPSKIAAAVQGIWNGPAARALDDLLSRLPRASTIVHVHGWAKALSPSIAGPIARSGLPAVYTVHEYFQFCPNGGFYDYRANRICTRTPLSASCWGANCDSRSYSRKIWRNVRLTSAKFVSQLPDLFSRYIVISDFQASIVRPLLPHGAQVVRVDNPICVPDLGPKADPASGEVLFVGRLSPEKGVFVFAEAARRAGLRPSFVGDGPLAGELARRYPEAKLLGWRVPADVFAAMRAARALVFSSVWYEGQPLTVLEAKALGLPIIVSDACAAREEVEDGVTGLWFESGNVDDLVRALHALDDDARVTAMSHAAHRAFWTSPRTLDLHVRCITDLYRTMLDEARSICGEAPARGALPTNWTETHAIG